MFLLRTLCKGSQNKHKRAHTQAHTHAHIRIKPKLEIHCAKRSVSKCGWQGEKWTQKYMEESVKEIKEEQGNQINLWATL